MEIKLIAFDLDGTILNESKELSSRNREALCRAADQGICLVPATGRIYAGMPEEIRSLPFLHYMIGVNGAEVYDIKAQSVLHRAELTREDARRVFAYAKQFPAVWSCYKNGTAWMERRDYERIDSFAASIPIGRTMKRLHHPVEHMQEELLRTGEGIQKLQMFFTDLKARDRILKAMLADFPDLSITTSLPNNIEINALEANKGAGLRFLCGYLGIELKECMAFGDGANDVSMIKNAGIGVAMGNACPELLAVADRVAKSNEEDGVAEMLEQGLDTFPGFLLF